MFVKDCCTSCAEMHAIVKEFKESKQMISRINKQISATLLLKIDKNTVYESGLFESRQKEYRSQTSQTFESCFQKVLDVLKAMYKNFKDGSPEVQREWKSQIAQIDKAFETSLKACVKRSLQDLSKAINGDSKTDPHSLFTVRIGLDRGVTYVPSMIELTHSLNLVAKEIINIVTHFPRIRNQNFDDAVKMLRQSMMEPSTSNLNASNSSSALNGTPNNAIGLNRSPSVKSMKKNTSNTTLVEKARLSAVKEATEATLLPVVESGLGETGGSAIGIGEAGGGVATVVKAAPTVKSYYEVISEDSDILKIVVQVITIYFVGLHIFLSDLLFWM